MTKLLIFILGHGKAKDKWGERLNRGLDGTKNVMALYQPGSFF